MLDRSSGGLPIGWLALAVLGGTLYPAPAFAHKLNLFAYAEGKTLQGEAYFRGGDPVRNAAVTVFDAEGRKLGDATTDEEGKFTFEARFGCDHKLVVDAGAGHCAEYTVPADELPGDLPPPTAAGRPPAETPVPPTEMPVETPVEQDVPTSPADKPATAPPSEESLETRGEALTRQIVQLRKQLDDHEQKTRWHDVLGGIGYILGLMGVVFYFLGVRRKGKGPGD